MKNRSKWAIQGMIPHTLDHQSHLVQLSYIELRSSIRQTQLLYRPGYRSMI
jgi:hypothetical protein